MRVPPIVAASEVSGGRLDAVILELGHLFVDLVQQLYWVTQVDDDLLRLRASPHRSAALDEGDSVIDRPDQADLNERPVHADMASTIGPVFTETAVLDLMGKTAEDLAAMRTARQILSAVTSDGHRVYPSAQFDGDSVIEGLADTLDAMASGGIDDWTLLLWFTAPDDDYLSGLSPLDWIIAGSDSKTLAAMVNATTAR